MKQTGKNSVRSVEPASRDEILAAFTKEVKRSFRFLKDKFTLSFASSQSHGFEFLVTYRDSTRRVLFYFEPYCLPWIVLEKKTNGSWRSKGLHQVYKKYFSKKMPKEMIQGENDFFDIRNLPFLKELLQTHLQHFFDLI